RTTELYFTIVSRYQDLIFTVCPAPLDARRCDKAGRGVGARQAVRVRRVLVAIAERGLWRRGRQHPHLRHRRLGPGQAAQGPLQERRPHGRLRGQCTSPPPPPSPPRPPVTPTAQLLGNPHLVSAGEEGYYYVWDLSIFAAGEKEKSGPAKYKARAKRAMCC